MGASGWAAETATAAVSGMLHIVTEPGATCVQGRYQRSFQLINLDNMAMLKQGEQPSSLNSFYRWQDAAWKRLTVSLR